MTERTAQDTSPFLYPALCCKINPKFTGLPAQCCTVVLKVYMKAKICGPGFNLKNMYIHTRLRLGRALNLPTCPAFESLAKMEDPVLALSFPGKCTSFCHSSGTLPMEQQLDLLAVEPLWLLEVVWVTNTPNGF